MGKECILAIDQGTTNTKALLVDRRGAPVFRVAMQIPLISTPQGFTEQDPGTHLGFGGKCSYQGSGIRKGAQLFGRGNCDLKPARNCVGMGCEEREGIGAGDQLAVRAGCGDLRSTCMPRRRAPVENRTAARAVDFGVKWAWLLENSSAVQRLQRKGDLRLGTVDTWLLHKLTQGQEYTTDLTNASRTGLLNLAELDWDREASICLEFHSSRYQGCDPLRIDSAIAPCFQNSRECQLCLLSVIRTPLCLAIRDTAWNCEGNIWNRKLR